MNLFKLPYNIIFEHITESATIRAFRLTKHLPIIFESDMLSVVHVQGRIEESRRK